jgi:hypothetical protein
MWLQQKKRWDERIEDGTRKEEKLLEQPREKFELPKEYEKLQRTSKISSASDSFPFPEMLLKTTYKKLDQKQVESLFELRQTISDLKNSSK